MSFVACVSVQKMGVLFNLPEAQRDARGTLESRDRRHSNGTGRIFLRGREGVARFAAAAVFTVPWGRRRLRRRESAVDGPIKNLRCAMEAFWEDFDQWDGSGYDSGTMLSRSLL